MFYKFFDKKTKGSGVKLTNKSIPQNEQLAEELHKPIIKKFKRREVYSEFKNHIWAADLADLITDIDFYYVLLIFIANMLGLFL